MVYKICKRTVYGTTPSSNALIKFNAPEKREKRPQTNRKEK
jgi:hypothetical protein